MVLKIEEKEEMNGGENGKKIDGFEIFDNIVEKMKLKEKKKRREIGERKWDEVKEIGKDGMRVMRIDEVDDEIEKVRELRSVKLVEKMEKKIMWEWFGIWKRKDMKERKEGKFGNSDKELKEVVEGDMGEWGNVVKIIERKD